MLLCWRHVQTCDKSCILNVRLHTSHFKFHNEQVTADISKGIEAGIRSNFQDYFGPLTLCTTRNLWERQMNE
jgi:hypothetical protein